MVAGPDDFAEQLVAEQLWLRKVAVRLGATGSEVDDLVQEVDLRALRFRHRFDGRNLRGWLARIAHNVLMTWRRHEALIRFEEIDEWQVSGGDVERQAIARLQLRQLDPILLLSVTMSQVELARRLRRSRATIGSRLRRSRQRARRNGAA